MIIANKRSAGRDDNTRGGGVIGGGKGVQGVLSMILCCHIFSMFQVPF